MADDRNRFDEQAAEYVLGTLRGDERARFERLMETDTAAAEAVARWEMRLQPLADALPPVKPDPAGWPAIERALDGVERQANAKARKRGLGGFLFERPLGAIPSVATAGLWYCVGFWRTLGLAGVAAAIVLAAIAIGDAPESGPSYVAVLEAENAPAALLAEYDPASGSVVLSPLAAPSPEADQSFELWLIAPDAAPESMGLVTDRNQRLALPPGRDSLPEGGILAISVEPAGGSPTGQPTGPVILQGVFHAVEQN